MNTRIAEWSEEPEEFTINPVSVPDTWPSHGQIVATNLEVR
jgi:hypothetical protein